MAFAYAVFAYVLVFPIIIVKCLKDANSPFPFDATEMRRFGNRYR
jgi:hypothetical protein